VTTLIQTAANAGIIPVALDGAWKLAGRSRGPIPRGIRLSIRILPELDRNGKTAKALVAEAETLISRAVEKIREDQQKI
jgi:hypothetical protein